MVTRIGVCLAVAWLRSAAALAAPVAVVNAGFEDPPLADNVSTDDDLPGWAGSYGVLADHNFGAFDVPTSFFPAEAPEGENVAYIQDGAIFQELADSLAPGDYTLTVQVGQSLVDPTSPFRVQLLAAGNLKAEATAPVAAAGTFATVTVTYTASENDGDKGYPLAIVLIDDGVPGLFEDEPYLDDVALDFEPAVPACAPAPLPDCEASAKAKLAVSEKKAGKEKLSAQLQSFGVATTQADLGSPLAGDTRYTLCVYTAADALAAALVVDRAGEVCGPKAKPCFKDKGGKGWSYKDPAAAASGVRALGAASGPAGKGKLLVKAGNNAARGRNALPTGVAAALQAASSATLQLLVSDGACFGAALSSVRVADGVLFKAKAP
jgi:hypothetical protein